MPDVLDFQVDPLQHIAGVAAGAAPRVASAPAVMDVNAMRAKYGPLWSPPTTGRYTMGGGTARVIPTFPTNEGGQSSVADPPAANTSRFDPDKYDVTNSPAEGGGPTVGPGRDDTGTGGMGPGQGAGGSGYNQVPRRMSFQQAPSLQAFNPFRRPIGTQPGFSGLVGGLSGPSYPAGSLLTILSAMGGVGRQVPDGR